MYDKFYRYFPYITSFKCYFCQKKTCYFRQKICYNGQKLVIIYKTPKKFEMCADKAQIIVILSTSKKNFNDCQSNESSSFGTFFQCFFCGFALPIFFYFSMNEPELDAGNDPGMALTHFHLVF